MTATLFVLLIINLIVSIQAFRLHHTKSKFILRSIEESKQEISKTSFETAQKVSIPGKSWLKCRPVGVGATPGQNVIPNDYFQSLVDTNDAWISKRTGIQRRHVIERGSSLRSIAAQAALEAIQSANINPLDIDLVIVATSSPDDLFGDAPSVASAIGATNAAAFDVTSACSGFVFGMITASQFIESGAYKRVLLVGADALTRFMDWTDRGSCILFGDGAGAIVLEATESKDESGILGFALHSDGRRYPHLKIAFQNNFAELPNNERTVVDQGEYTKMTMNGPEVYKFAVNEVPAVINEALNNAGLQISDIDWLLLHQANSRIMEHVASVLKISEEKVIKNLNEYGNTSAGSIPLALAEAVKSGKVKKGDIIAVAGFGAGLSWGSAIVRW